MFISDFAIKKPIVTIVSMVALMVFGLFALGQLQTDEFPDVAQPIVNVAVPYPGASPDVVERELLDRLEEAISGISGVDRISGTAQDGFANVTVFFVFEKDIQQASQDIRDKISAIRGDLPAEMKEPILSRFDPSDQPIVQLSLNSSSLDAPSLTRIADPGMTKELRAIPGVADALVVGGVQRELTVEINPQDAWAVHAVAHVLEMQDRTDEGIAWLDRYIPGLSVCNNFRFHTTWHRCLFYLEKGAGSRVLELYDREVRAVQAEAQVVGRDEELRLLKELLAATGETTDCCVVWLPDHRVALVSNLFGPLFPHFPNLNTIRGDKYRFVEPQLATNRMVRELRPEVLVTGRHEPIVGVVGGSRSDFPVLERAVSGRDLILFGGGGIEAGGQQFEGGKSHGVGL